jgi:hypothetical protein
MLAKQTWRLIAEPLCAGVVGAKYYHGGNNLKADPNA